MADVGGKVVRVLGFKVELGPEVLASWKQAEAEKRTGHWQTRNPLVKWFMRTVAKKAGHPDVFREG
jgi:hypothetical protein